MLVVAAMRIAGRAGCAGRRLLPPACNNKQYKDSNNSNDGNDKISNNDNDNSHNKHTT